MFNFLLYLLPVLFGAAAVGVCVYWTGIRERVADWLHRRGLEKSALMEAWVEADRLVSRIRTKILVRTWDSQVHVVATETYSIEEVDDPDVLRQINRDGTVRTSILHQL